MTANNILNFSEAPYVVGLANIVLTLPDLPF